ncbi:hypothetical protein OC844_002865 [Tilletia horrida]|nr:hypothetical protein OC844_002865 [Tilletia horrida]
MPGAFVSPLRRPGVEGRLNAAAGPRQGMPGRQMPTSASAAAPGATPASAATVSPNWTIVNLPLASPADVRKYPREDINGALSYTSLLLQLLSAYLGISMPFVIESQGGRNIIMPNELWSGTGAKKHIVQLTENAYEALKAINTSSNDRSNDPNGASAFGLGASALSVLESFVQLPSTARLTSMLGPSGSESGNAQQGGIASNGSGGGGTGSSTGTTISSAQQGEAASRSAAVEEYLSVVSMLSYNAAYVAHVQGVRVDLVAAATSPLALLARAMASKTLGVRAHATYAADAHIRNLGRNDMDWSQVRHVLGGSRSSGGGGGGSTSTSGGESVGKSAGAGRMPTVAATSSGKTGASTSTSKATAARTSLAVATARGEPRSRTTANTATTGSATKLSSRRAGQHRSGGGDAAVAEDDWDVV